MGAPFLSSRVCRVGVGILILGFPFSGVWAQKATVTGVVVERTQSSWIGGATVRLSGSSPFFTDLDGAFQFTRVVPGRHTLTVQALGYQTVSMELVVRADTAMVIEMDPDPILLDSLLVRGGTVTVRGKILDARTGLRVLYGYVTVQPVMSPVGAVSGHFTVRRVPIGQPLTVLVEAATYLPARIALIPDSDTTLTVELEPDPVGIRMLEIQVEKLETRSHSIPYSTRVIDRDELAAYSGWSVFEIAERQVFGMGRRGDPRRTLELSRCVFLDDVQLPQPGFLWGLWGGEVERLEIFDRGGMVRVYTKRYLLSQLGRDPQPMLYNKTGLMGPVCR